ncbi:G-type lectin S-receptor-like serine/threonine-protein kinase B120 [Linum perenne]
MDYHLCIQLIIIIIISCLSQKSHMCMGADMITENQSLSADQTLVSAGSRFELGFFKPGNSSNYYLGIWYHQVSIRTVVWVANRESPIFNHNSTVLRFSGGNLALFSGSQVPIWITDSTPDSTTTSSKEALLLDNGNLVIRSMDSSEILWQSFDHPTDTLLPGSRLRRNKINGDCTTVIPWKSEDDPSPGDFSLQLDPNGTTEIVIIRNKSSLHWTSGPWNGRFFSLVPEMAWNEAYNNTYVDNEKESYFAYSLYNDSNILRKFMSYGGNYQVLSWAEPSHKWDLFWSQPRLQCQVHYYCGAFGSCNDLSRPSCHCIKGFVPKSKDEFSSNVFYNGCTRKAQLQCGGSRNDTFISGYAVSDKMSGSPAYRSLRNVEQCESICLDSCTCSAYAYEDSSCSIWSGDIYNIHRHDASDPTGVPIYVRIATELQSSGTKWSKGKVYRAVFGSIAVALLISFLLFAVLRWYCRHKLGKNVEQDYCIANGDEETNSKLTFFNIRTILAATDNFSEANKLGEGGFGPVYKGILPPDNQEVAVKRLSKKSGQGLEEFMNELKLIARLQHNYLVRLLGCCVEKEEKILIYEYLPNRSLDKLLFDSSAKAELDWLTRIKIIEGIAQGLLYIHKYSRLKVIHRDMKASNVLLDAEMNPKISDFGMARIFGIDQAEASTNRIVGTYGYMSPEYAFYGQFSEKSDVFSYGVLLLEIVSGRRNTDFHHSKTVFSLLCWTWELWKEGKPEDLIDPAVKDTCINVDEAVKFIHVGLLCVQEDPAERPPMSSVAKMLSSNDSGSFPLPGEPAFIARRSAAVVESGDLAPSNWSINHFTVSLPTGR